MAKKQTKNRPSSRNATTCGRLLAQMSEYVDGELDPALCRELEAHLAKCNPCRVVVDNVRQTITLYRRGTPCRLPAAFRKRLHAFLRQRWKSLPLARQE